MEKQIRCWHKGVYMEKQIRCWPHLIQMKKRSFYDSVPDKPFWKVMKVSKEKNSTGIVFVPCHQASELM